MFHLLNKFFPKKFICKAPFSQIYIYHDGRVFLCPDCYLKKTAEIGNLNNNSFDEIWNSKQAQEIRKETLKGNYPYCSPAFCHSKTNYHAKFIPNKNISYKQKQKKYPQMVCIGPDWECNVNCIMCRKEISRLSDDMLKEVNKRTEEIYLPILKDANELTLSTTSDPFASRSTRFLIKSASEQYPKLKFNLLTNGILCDEFNCKQLGIENKISNVMVSIHASNEETYNAVVKNGNFNKVIENIKWLKNLKNEHKIKELYLAFVVTNKNYQDIPNFIKFAKKNDGIALFWVCVDWGGNLKWQNEPLTVWQKKHPNHDKLADILYKIDIDDKNAYFCPQLKAIRKEKEKQINQK